MAVPCLLLGSGSGKYREGPGLCVQPVCLRAQSSSWLLLLRLGNKGLVCVLSPESGVVPSLAHDQHTVTHGHCATGL